MEPEMSEMDMTNITTTLPDDKEKSTSKTEMFLDASSKVKLLSSDGEAFTLDYGCVQQSGTIKSLLESSPNWVENRTGVLEFPCIESKILRKVVEYLIYKQTHDNDSVEEFFIEPEMALDMMLAADYLDFSLPFSKESESRLREDWNRFLDGSVTIAECPDAIKGEFICEAEVIQEEAIESSVDQDGNDVQTSLPSGKGKLILTCSKLYWIQGGASNEDQTATIGWSIDYKNLILHAITTQSERPCVYLQLNYTKIYDPSGLEIISEEADAEEGDDGDDEKFVEINLFLEENKMADELFIALSECAALHPDTDDNESDCDLEVASSEGIEESVNKKTKCEEKRFEDAAEN